MTKRDDFSSIVKRLLEDRVASVCSKPGCGQVTRGPSSEEDGTVNLGEAAHITAAAVGGPRYDDDLSPEERAAVTNGIWLCRRHARLVDVDESPYSVETLRGWKREAEAKAHEAVEQGRIREAMPLLISVLHRSMEFIPERSLEGSLPVLFRSVSNQELVLDQCELYRHGRLTDQREALRRQVRAAAQLESMITNAPGVDVAYYGIAHIPLVFHFGHILSRGLSVYLAERGREANSWHWFDELNEFSALILTPPLTSSVQEATDVVVRISVSYEVYSAQTDSCIRSPAVYELRVPVPTPDIVRSRRQIDDYSKIFRHLLDHLAGFQNIKRVHLFVAAPVSLCFAFGRQVRTTVHPSVYVYNYRRGDNPAYQWGVRMTDDVEQDDAVRVCTFSGPVGG